MRENTTLPSLALDDLNRVTGGCKQRQAPPPPQMAAAPPPPPPPQDSGLDVSVKVAHGPGAAQAAASGAQQQTA